MALSAVFSRRKTRVLQQIRSPRGLEQSLPCVLMTGEMNDEGLLIARNQTIDPAPRKIIARDRLAAVQVIGDVGFDERQAHLKQRDIDKLPSAGFLPREQRCHNAVGRKDA